MAARPCGASPRRPGRACSRRRDRHRARGRRARAVATGVRWSGSTRARRCSPRPARSSPRSPALGARIELVRGEAERLPFADAEFDALTFTYLLRYVDDPAATMRELARVVRPGGTIVSLEFGVPPWPWRRALWLLHTRFGLPALGGSSHPRLVRGRTLPGAEHQRLLRALSARGARCALAGARGSIRACSAHEPRRRRRHLGGPWRWPLHLERPAFYALRAGGWRDLITLLHPPYTAWHLSYVALGAAAAPTCTATASLPRSARSSSGWASRARARRAERPAAGHRALRPDAGHAGRRRARGCGRRSAWSVLVVVSVQLAPLVARGRVHRRRLQPRAVRRTLPQRLMVRRLPGARSPRSRATGPTRCELRPRRCPRHRSPASR